MNYCNFIGTELGCTCSVCGKVVRNHSGKGLISECRPKCRYLGEQVGIELIQCQTCQGNVRIKYAVNACDVFEKCLPTYVGNDAEIRVCHGCKHFAINHNAT